MRFACPHCEAHLQAEAQLAGKTIKCPACGGRVAIPENVVDEESLLAHTQRVSVSAPAEKEEEAAMEAAGAAMGGTGAVWQSTDNANVPMWQSVLIGFGITFLWFLLMQLLKAPEGTSTDDLSGTQTLAMLFLERSWVQYATTFLTAWCVGILIMKWAKLRHQRRAMLLEILPHDINDDISPENAPQFYQHLTELPARVKDSYIVSRVRRGLEYFWVRRNNPEVAAMMNSQSDIEANGIASSYSIVKVFLWAIPIMGFIGTVLGIGYAIGQFAVALSGAEATGDPSAVVGSLREVTGGLGTAFDTTLVALVFSILVSFPASALQKSEEELLNSVDEYCNENFLKRLNDGGAGLGETGESSDIIQRIGDAIARNQKEMMEGLREIHDNAAKAQTEQIAAFKEASDAIEKQAENLESRAKHHQMLIDDNFTRLIEGVQKDAMKSINRLSEGLAGLNGVLKDLGGKQVKIEKRGWFFGRK